MNSGEIGSQKSYRASSGESHNKHKTDRGRIPLLHDPDNVSAEKMFWTSELGIT